MFLDTVNIPKSTAVQHTADVAKGPAHEPWLHFPHSCISHHGTACCDTARAWFAAMDFSLLAGASSFTGPRWIRARWEWGPSTHPIHWCEAVRAKTLDCGALGALAHEAFRARGAESFPLQLVQQYSSEATAHWGDSWAAKDVSVHWLGKDVIYHEGCAVRLADGTIRLWDASAAWWIADTRTGGYGSVTALRIFAPEAAPGAALQWGERKIPLNGWVTLQG